MCIIERGIARDVHRSGAIGERAIEVGRSAALDGDAAASADTNHVKVSQRSRSNVQHAAGRAPGEYSAGCGVIKILAGSDADAPLYRPSNVNRVAPPAEH